MKTSVIGIGDMLSVLSVSGVEKRIGDVPGVESVTVNFAAGNATVRFDETRLNLSDIKSDVRQSGYDAEAMPTDPAAGSHESHAAPSATAKDGESMPPKSALAAVATAGAAPDGDAPPDKASGTPSPSATPESPAAAAAPAQTMPGKT